MRDSFETGETHKMQWIPRMLKIDDAITKKNLATFAILIEIMKTGILRE